MLNNEVDYDLEIRWRYVYSDGISVVAFSKEDADMKHDKIIKDVINSWRKPTGLPVGVLR